jgi:Protein of unknown function (DUF4245)
MARLRGSAQTAAIVAELGRPETPSETADRKALSARNRRANQTPINLILAIAASLLIVVFLLVVVVRPNAALTEPVNYHRVAVEAQQTVSEPLADPALTKEWTANDAELKTGRDGVENWYIGLITPGKQFIALSQGISANETWTSNQLDGKAATGNSSVGGLDWTIYDHRAGKDPGNLAYAMTTTEGTSTIVLFGTADNAEFTTLASAVAADLKAKGGNQ